MAAQFLSQVRCKHSQELPASTDAIKQTDFGQWVVVPTNHSLKDTCDLCELGFLDKLLSYIAWAQVPQVADLLAMGFRKMKAAKASDQG